jgi:hypothetical protein
MKINIFHGWCAKKRLARASAIFETAAEGTMNSMDEAIAKVTRTLNSMDGILATR